MEDLLSSKFDEIILGTDTATSILAA